VESWGNRIPGTEGMPCHCVFFRVIWLIKIIYSVLLSYGGSSCLISSHLAMLLLKYLHFWFHQCERTVIWDPCVTELSVPHVKYSSCANVTGWSSLAYIEQPMASHVALDDCWITTQ
jgi:hypothetical protein